MIQLLADEQCRRDQLLADEQCRRDQLLADADDTTPLPPPPARRGEGLIDYRGHSWKVDDPSFARG